MNKKKMLIESDAIPAVSPNCSYCLHWSFLGRTCAAFPDGIPMDIWIGENDHTKPYPGDHGILFELDPRFADLGKHKEPVTTS